MSGFRPKRRVAIGLLRVIQVVNQQRRSDELVRIKGQCPESGYGGVVSPCDEILVADRGTQLVEAVRFCKEYGTVGLRGMRVREESQRQGIGTSLLKAGETVLGGRTCYFPPYRHLQAFCGQAGFVKVLAAEAPQELRDRLTDYQARGLNVITMRGDPMPPVTASNGNKGRAGI